jgi:cyclase
MLKKRIVAVLVVKDGIVVQSGGFKCYLPVGKPEIAMEFLDDWGVDEIILLDISATREGRAPDYAMVRNGSARCHVPLTVGGGITSTEQILELMHCGADKVSLNQVAFQRPGVIGETARIFGSQCVVASIDSLRIHGRHCVYDYVQRKALQISTAEFAHQLQERGAGEILINSVDRDGAKCGFDLDLINEVCAAVRVPVICCGGAGKPQDFIDVLERTHASAVAAANFFHFTEHSVTTTKAQISRLSVPVRHETYAQYKNNQLDDTGRLLKKDDRVLEELLYQRVAKEVI